jgi:hypothetical protein
MDDIKIVMTFHEWTLFYGENSIIHPWKTNTNESWSEKRLSYSLCLWIGFLNPQPINVITNTNAI